MFKKSGSFNYFDPGSSSCTLFPGFLVLVGCMLGRVCGVSLRAGMNVPSPERVTVAPAGQLEALKLGTTSSPGFSLESLGLLRSSDQSVSPPSKLGFLLPFPFLLLLPTKAGSLQSCGIGVGQRVGHIVLFPLMLKVCMGDSVLWDPTPKQTQALSLISLVPTRWWNTGAGWVLANALRRTLLWFFSNLLTSLSLHGPTWCGLSALLLLRWEVSSDPNQP